MGCKGSKTTSVAKVAPVEHICNAKVVPGVEAAPAPANVPTQAQVQAAPEPENEPGASATDSVQEPMENTAPSIKTAKSAASNTSSQGAPSRGNMEWARSDKKLERVRRQKDASSAPKQSLTPEIGQPAVAVSPENKHFLKKILQKHFLFEGLEDDEINMIIPFMRQTKISTGEVIFSQGQKGDCCYIIQQGVFAVSIDERQLKQLRPKQTFGELAMLYNVNRTATVSCSAAGVLWVMDGDSFRMAMDKLSAKHVQRAMDFFATDSTFKSLSEDEQHTLARACSVQVFGRGEQILREGEVGDWMFIVIEGTVQTVDRFGNQAVKKPGTLLGSAGLMYGKHQVAGAKAIDNVSCLALGKTALERLLGNVEEVLRRGAIKALLQDAKSTDLSFFKQLEDEQQKAVISKFEHSNFQGGETIISKGNKAQLVVVSEGEIAVLPGTTDEATRASPTAARPAAREVLSVGTTYGGSSLVSGVDVDDFLVALSSTTIHRISVTMVMEALQAPLSEIIRLNEIKKVLGDIFLFKNLTNEQIDRTVRSLVAKAYSAGETIVEQGDEAHDFYLIQRGTIKVCKEGALLRSLGRWDYFGERALLLEEKRSATCTADEACTCLSLDKAVFRDIVGIFRQELEHRMNLQDLNITMGDLCLKAVVGRGSFGVVKLCFHKNDDKRLYALKCVSKKQVVKQGQQKSIVVERDINAQCYHPCIMQFIKTFQDGKYVYFLTEFLGGGDLFYAIREIGNLTKVQAQFYGGSITLALQYLHARNIMYRDLKPENVLLDFKGNAKLVDMGCCKKAVRTNTLVGTPEYFAPETILGKGYTGAIDWWALGVMMHEFIVGPLPFGRDSEDQLDLFREILEAALQFPSYVTDQTSVSVVTGLLERTPEMRLGASVKGAKEIKEHPYFVDFDWDALAGRYMPPPWTPNQKKLQCHWEMADKKEATVGEGGVGKDAGFEPGMAWAAGF